jgi:hypothetical protein
MKGEIHICPLFLRARKVKGYKFYVKGMFYAILQPLCVKS